MGRVRFCVRGDGASSLFRLLSLPFPLLLLSFAPPPFPFHFPLRFPPLLPLPLHPPASQPPPSRPQASSSPPQASPWTHQRPQWSSRPIAADARYRSPSRTRARARARRCGAAGRRRFVRFRARSARWCACGCSRRDLGWCRIVVGGEWTGMGTLMF